MTDRNRGREGERGGNKEKRSKVEEREGGSNDTERERTANKTFAANQLTTASQAITKELQEAETDLSNEITELEADVTSRIQTVEQNHEVFYSLLFEFKRLTGIPMLLNTSLNDNQKPIAGHPKDALNLL